MKGTIRSIRVAGLLLGVVALLALSHTAQAQKEDLRYNFALPFAVQWQGQTLPAGEYHFIVQAVPSSTSGILLIRDTEGRPKTATLPIILQTGRDFSNQSDLTIVSRNGKRYVQSLHLGQVGATRVYAVPNPSKAEERELAAQAQVVPIQVAGNRN